MGIPKDLVIYAPKSSETAYKISEKLGIELVSKKPDNTLYLKSDDTGLSLNQGNLELKGDFEKLLPRLKKNNLEREFLVKASKTKTENPVAIDATAGMGEDSLLLAAAGYRVIMYEYDLVIAELLADTMRRASKNYELSEIVGRMELVNKDSIKGMKMLNFTPDLILLDPMFPERQKSALVKKKFQLLQQLQMPCTNEEELLNTAMALKPHKILIKRPLKGEYLAGKKPSYSIKGKAVRYDCIVIS